MTNQPRGELVPGGLALVIGAHNCPENIGLAVVTERRVSNGDIHGGFLIVNRGWVVIHEDILGRTSSGIEKLGWAVVDECHLMPINPSADPLEIKQNQETYA